MTKVKALLGFISTLAICHVTYSQIMPLHQFYVQVTCSGNKGTAGFGAKAEQICIRYNSGEKCLPQETDETNDSSSGEVEKDDLSEQFVLALAREYCQGNKTTTIRKLNITRTVTVGRGVLAPDQDDSSTGTVSKISSDDEDNQQQTIQSLKMGVALGTIFGFFFGVFVTGAVLMIAMRKYKQRISSQKVKLIETASDNVKPYEKNHNASNYEYCDVEDGNYQLPREGACTESNNPIVSPTYDSNHTYNHLNESNDINSNAKYYDHFRGTSGDEQLANGEYKVLELRQEADGADQLTNDEQPTNGEYRVLESRRGASGDEQPTNDEYKVLESRRGASGDEQMANDERPTNGEYKVLELRYPQANSSGEPSKFQSKINSHENESNYFEIEKESIQSPEKDAYFVLEKEPQ